MANDFNQTVGSLFQGMDSLLTTKTVVGEPTKVGDTIILPLVDVNFDHVGQMVVVKIVYKNASQTIACPPAIPIAVCGERIDQNMISIFEEYGIDYVNVVSY